jgi:hypothetical protein
MDKIALESGGKSAKFTDICLDFFRKEDVQRYAKDIVRPVVNVIYNQIYPYVWTICLYCVFLFFLTLVNLILLLRVYYFLNNLFNGFEFSSSPSCAAVDQ